MDMVIVKPIGEMNAIEHWVIFFQYLTDKTQRRKINEIIDCEEGIAMTSEILMSISKDEVEKARQIEDTGLTSEEGEALHKEVK